MRRSKPMKRTGFKSSADKTSTLNRTPMKRTTGLRPRSKKMEEKYHERRALVVRLLRERPWCEAGEKIWGFIALKMPNGVAMGMKPTGIARDIYWHKVWVPGHQPAPKLVLKCQGTSQDVHEALARSAGGSILDEANCMTVCRQCHTFIGDNPRIAMALGLRKSRYNREIEPN